MIFGELFAGGLALMGYYTNLYIGLLLMVPMAIDGGLQFYGIAKSNNFRRVVTGVLFGIGFIGAVASTVVFILK